MSIQLTALCIENGKRITKLFSAGTVTDITLFL